MQVGPDKISLSANIGSCYTNLLDFTDSRKSTAAYCAATAGNVACLRLYCLR
jgi:hypothetical protein